MIKNRIYPTALLSLCMLMSLFFSVSAYAQNESLKKTIQQIVNTTDGITGVAIKHIESNETLSVNGKKQYPMQSVYKFPLAMAVLDQVDKGKFTLDQKIHITKKDVAPKTWSPLTEKYPNGEVDIPLSEILSYVVSLSDNNGCDILFRLLGGTQNVNKYVHDLGVKNIAIAATEEEMSKAWPVQFTNWSHPEAMLQLLDIFYAGKHLSKSSTDFLWKIMVETSTGPKKLKGLLPEGTTVAHKTGSSGTNKMGVTAASNDAGIIVLPNGKHIEIVVFVCNTTAKEEAHEALIAKIARAAWDHYAAK